MVSARDCLNGPRSRRRRIRQNRRTGFLLKEAGNGSISVQRSLFRGLAASESEADVLFHPVQVQIASRGTEKRGKPRRSQKVGVDPPDFGPVDLRKWVSR